MIQYPMSFPVSASSSSGIQKRWTSEAQLQKLTLAIPPEFEGPGEGLSPEDLYALALQNCFIATFKVFAEKSRLSFEAINTEAVLQVDRDENGKPWMARFHLKVKLLGVEQKESAQRLLEKTSQGCMILNSVKTAKTFEFQVG